MVDRGGVTRTATEACICKSSSASLFPDQFSCGERMRDGSTVRKRTQNPLLNRVYLSRHLVIQKMISSCLKAFQRNCIAVGNNYQRIQLLLLGAGTDITFEELYSDTTRTFAVDFPEVIERRMSALQDSKIRDTSSTSIAGDLRCFDKVWDQLLLSGFDKNCSTIVLIECVLCYIDTPSVLKMLQQINALICGQSVLITYDPMSPMSSASESLLPYQTRKSNTFAQMMVDKFGERRAPILHCIGSTTSQEKFIKSCGWKYVKSVNMFNALRAYLCADERNVPILAEPFDEFASLALIHKLYGVSIASCDMKMFDACLVELVGDTEDYTDRSTASKCSYGSHGIIADVSTSSRNSPVQDTSRKSQIILSECSQHSDENTLTSLLFRLNVAEQRVHILAEKNRRSNSGKFFRSNGRSFRMREASRDDSASIIALYQECFSVVTEKYPAVRKFVKKSVKSLANIESEFCTKTGSNFWIIETDKESIIESEVKDCVSNASEEFSDLNDHDMKKLKMEMKKERDKDKHEERNVREKRTRVEHVIVGCIGLKVKHSSLGPTSENTSNSSSHRTASDSSKSTAFGQIKNVQNSPALTLLSHFTADPQIYEGAVGEVSHMCVSSAHRKLGLAKVLLTNLIEFASNSNYRTGMRVESVVLTETTSYTKLTSLELSVIADLIPARTLYLDSRFEEVGPLVDVGENCRLQHMSLRL